MSKYKDLKNTILLSSLIIYIIIYRLFVVDNLLKYSEFISATVLIFIVSIAIAVFGYRKDKITPLTKQVTIITTTQIVLFFALSYALGLAVGFLKNSYSLTPDSLLNNIFAPIVVIVCIELFRYVMINANRANKKMIFLLTTVLIIFEIFITIGNVNFKDLAELFKIATSVILPIIVKNTVLSYLTLTVGYRPAIIYRMVMDLYVFVMPIIPNLGEYIESMIGICLPFLIYLFASRTIDEHYNGIEYEFQKSIFKLTDIPIIAFIVILVCLISGYFPTFAVGIATESMTPKINKGDAVIANKVYEPKKLKKGMIIVYKNNGKNIVHRIVKIEKVGKRIYYRTKGDANPTNDNTNVEFKDIRGVVQFKIPYIAYPSIYFSEKVKLGV